MQPTKGSEIRVIMKEKWPNIPTKLSPPWRMSAGTIKVVVALLTKTFLSELTPEENLKLLPHTPYTPSSSPCRDHTESSD